MAQVCPVQTMAEKITKSKIYNSCITDKPHFQEDKLNAVHFTPKVTRHKKPYPNDSLIQPITVRITSREKRFSNNVEAPSTL